MESLLLVQPSTNHSQRSSQDQGIATIQIFLNAAVACIAHTRELIPWVSTCFQTRYANQLTTKTSSDRDIYTDFCNALQTPFNAAESQEFRILIRGRDRRADCILDMIEGGITDALQQCFLEAFQLFVVADTKNPASTLETYTFTFSYDHGVIDQIDISTSTNNSLVVKKFRSSFTKSIRALLKLMQDLPRLPRRRSLGISLIYNQSCPQDYQPAGFMDVELYQQIPLTGCWSDLWLNLPTPIAELSSGHLKVTVGAQDLRFVNGMSCSRLQDRRVSIQLQKMQKTSSQDQRIPTTEAMTVLHGSQAIMDNASQTAVKMTDELRKTKPESSHNQDFHSRNSTPLDNGMQPRAKHTTFAGSTNGLAKLSVASKNRRRRNVVASKLAELLVQARAMENNHSGPYCLFDKDQLHVGKIKRLDRSGAVRCECGSPHESTDTLLCELCGTTQHKTCYGYESLRPGCLPEEHFCYNCLLLPREDCVSRGMPGIVHMRLALLYLASQPSSRVEVGQEFMHAIFHVQKDPSMGLSALMDRLTHEGYIRKRSSGIIHILDNDKSAEAQNRYLDPLASIVHHYQIVRDGDTSEKRNHEIMRALRLYVGDRQFQLSDKTNAYYDRIHVKNNIGQEVVRWGFYASRKRKRVESINSTMTYQKVSISNKFININRSTPSEPMSMDEMMQEAVLEASWDLCLRSRLNSDATEFN